MGIGSRLRHTITIERKTLGAQNEYGVAAETWTALATVKAWYQPDMRKEGVEDTSGGTLREDGTFYMLDTDIGQADRIVYNGETYRITDVHDPAGRRSDRHLEVRASITRVV